MGDGYGVCKWSNAFFFFCLPEKLSTFYEEMGYEHCICEDEEACVLT